MPSKSLPRPDDFTCAHAHNNRSPSKRVQGPINSSVAERTKFKNHFKGRPPLFAGPGFFARTPTQKQKQIYQDTQAIINKANLKR